MSFEAKALRDAIYDLAEVFYALQDAEVDSDLVSRTEQLLSELEKQTSHECRDNFESYEHEFVEDSVVVRGDCKECGRELAEVYELSQLVDTEIGETVHRFQETD